MHRLWLIASIAAAALLLGATPARADPISAAILAFIGIEATAIAVAVTTAVIQLALGVGLSYLAAALAPKPKIEIPIGGSSGKLTAGGSVPRSFIVGRGMTAGSLVYANTFGNSGNTPNAYFVQVIALSDLPVTGLAEVLINGEPVTWNPGGTPGPDGIAIPEYNKDGKEHLWVRFYDGRQTVADARLVAKFEADSGRPYQSARVGRGVAYAVVTALVEQDLFSGFPTMKFVLDGIPLYDRRFDSTAGGSGPQRLSDPTTWALTANPVVVTENILRGIRYSGAWLYGGQTVSGPQLPQASWVAAANECDDPIALVAGGTEPQFLAGGEIRLDVQPAEAIEELLKACNGRLAEIGGTYKIRAGAAGAAVFSFTDADILSTEQQTFEPFPSLGQIINNVTAKYVSPGEGWNFKDAPALIDTALETADGGRRQSVDVAYGFVQSGTAVQRLMRSERNDQRAWRRHALPMPPDAFLLEPIDVISWTSTRNGYTAKLFEVLSADDLPNLNMALALKELDPAAYDWNPATNEKAITDGSISIAHTPGQGIIAWFAQPYTIQAGNLRRAAIRLGWDPNTDDVDGVRYEVRLTATGEIVLSGEVDLNGFKAGSVIVSQNLLPATDYQARGQYRPVSPRPVIFSDWLDVTTPNIRISTDDLDSELTARVQQIIDQIPADLLTIRRDLDDIAGAVGGLTTTNFEQVGRALIAVGSRYQENKAGIDLALTATADVDSALSAFILSLFAETPEGSAHGFIRFVVAAEAADAVASFAVEVNVGTAGSPDWARAGIYLDAIA
jgi:hypothetical protein